MKIKFEIVDAQVEKMYDFTITDVQDIDRRCLEIQDFIEKCGWNLDDYIRRMMNFSDQEMN